MEMNRFRKAVDEVLGVGWSVTKTTICAEDGFTSGPGLFEIGKVFMEDDASDYKWELQKMVRELKDE